MPIAPAGLKRRSVGDAKVKLTYTNSSSGSPRLFDRTPLTIRIEILENRWPQALCDDLSLARRPPALSSGSV